MEVGHWVGSTRAGVVRKVELHWMKMREAGVAAQKIYQLPQN